MKLTYEQIKEITFGAVRTEKAPDGIHFYKCTQKQIAAWERQSEFLGGGAAGSTGVRLDFHTSSQSLAFTVAAGGKFELYIDGVLRRQLLMGEQKSVTVPLCDALGHPHAEYRVTLVFPSHGAGGVLTELVLDDGATVHPHRHDIKMLFIGDSITQGWASKYDSFSYAWRVTRHFNADSVIQGIGGAYFEESCFDVVDFDPEVVLLAYGTNDFSHRKSYEECRAHMEAYLSLVAEHYRDKKVFVILPIWRDKREGKAMGSFEECRALLAREAEQRGFITVDGLSLVPPMPEFFEDAYLHPNDEGFSLYAENLIIQLEKYLNGSK